MYDEPTERERAGTLRTFDPSPGQIGDANQKWEVRKLIGKEFGDGVLHYLVVMPNTRTLLRS
jgi:hypothetical protein